MKKSIAVFGGYRFMNMVYNDGNFIPVYNYLINKLKLNNDVTNFAKGTLNLTSQVALIKNMTKACRYDEIVLSLGEFESTLNPSNLLLFMRDIKKELDDLFSYLSTNKIATQVELLPNESKGIELINKLVAKECQKYGIKIMNNNTYQIKEIGKKKLDFCSLYI